MQEKHGQTSRRSWRKLHLAVDADTGYIVASILTEQDVDDPSQVGPLFDQIEHGIGQVTADGAYDGDPTYETIAQHDPQIEVVIPPRTIAQPSAQFETDPTMRDMHLLMIQSLGRLDWQEASGYGKRALVETTMGRYKAIIGPRLRARMAGSAYRGGRCLCGAQPHAGCRTLELHPHFSPGGISRTGVGVSSPAA